MPSPGTPVHSGRSQQLYLAWPQTGTGPEPTCSLATPRTGTGLEGAPGRNSGGGAAPKAFTPRIPEIVDTEEGLAVARG